MVQGYCYKLSRVETSYIEAEIHCKEDFAILAEPKTFIESEFLESLITYLDNPADVTTKTEKVWLKFRKEDPNEDQFFDIMSGNS
jgi:hypothetical protein